MWDDYRGDGVVVAIVDTGIDYGHPDLAANYRHDLDFDARDHDMDSFASTAGDDHGTVVAGVVAATLGGGDTVGVAPGAQVTGFRMGFGADSTIGQVATQMQNMATVDVANNSWSYGGFFVDNLDNPDFSRRRFGDGATVGYNNEEIAMGWRLPPPGEAEPDVREFAASLVSGNVANPGGEMQYRSPNTDILGWIAERVSGGPLRDMLIEAIEAAGIAGNYHMATDRVGTPVIAGGASMTARDLARFSLLFARGGLGIEGRAVGSARFIAETRSGRGTVAAGWGDAVRYSNHTFTNGR